MYSVGAAGRVASQEAKVATMETDILKYGVDALQDAERELKAAKEAVPKISDAARRSSATSSAVYLIGSTFSVISVGSKDDGSGQVAEGDLTPVLRDIFDSARKSLNRIGKLGVGGGGNYSTVPHQNGTGVPLAPDMYIAGLFSDGNMLLGESNPAFNNTINAAFSKFRSKIVDQALQTAGYRAVARIDMEKKSCTNTGMHWIVPPKTDGYCFALYQKNKGGGSKRCPGRARRCPWAPAPDKVYSALTDKYDFDLGDYYMAAYNCTISKRKDNSKCGYIRIISGFG